MARRYQRHSRQVATRARAVTQQAYSRSHTNQLLASAARHPVSSEYIGNRPEQRIIRNRLLLLWLLLSFPVVTAVSQPITWQYSITVPNPGPEPTASVTVPQGVQGGTIKISWQRSWVLNTATAKLQLISQSGNAQTLATQLSGSLSFDTTTVPDGVYSVELTVSTPTGLTVTASQPLVIENTLL